MGASTHDDLLERPPVYPWQWKYRETNPQMDDEMNAMYSAAHRLCTTLLICDEMQESIVHS